MKNLYSSSLTSSHYHTIIIGSGMGGLTTAVLLAKAGKKVLVLEKHYVPGGFTHTFKRKKYEWDVGVHYVGQVHDTKCLLRKSFDFLTDSKLKWGDMGEVYDRAIIDGDVYDFPKGYDNQVKQMITYFPEEKGAIQKYYKLVKKISTRSMVFFAERTMPAWLSNTVGYFMRRGFYKYSDKTTYEVLKSFTTNEKLISVLCAQCGNYGLAPKESSFAIHAMVIEHFLEGGNYPSGGAKSIHQSMIEVIEKNGGTVAISADVKNIIIKSNKAVGVKMQNDDELYASNIVSNAGAHNTFNKLLLEENKNTITTSQINELSSSLSHICLYVGLNASDEELNLPKHNIWIYDGYNFDLANNTHLNCVDSASPITYISFPSAKDNDWKHKHPDMATIQVICSFPFHWMKEWENLKWQKRGDEYENKKEEITKLLLEKLYNVVPQVKNKIEITELSTPLSTKHFSNYAQGEIYGLAHTPKRFRVKQLRANTTYKNLFITGQDIVCVGVGAALFSGIITATSILKQNVMWKIIRYKSEK